MDTIRRVQWSDVLLRLMSKTEDGDVILCGDTMQPEFYSPWQIPAPSAGHDGIELPSMVGFRTSGSTGPPRLYWRSRECIRREVEIINHCVGWEKATEIICYAPVFHAFGFLCGLMQAHYLRCKFTFLDHFSAPGRAFHGRDDRSIVLVALPATWALIVRDKALLRSGRQIHVLHSAGPLPRRARELVDVWPNLRITEILGTTETGGVAFRNSGGQCPSEATSWTLFDDVHPILNSGNSDREILRVTGPRLAGQQPKPVTSTMRPSEPYSTGDVVTWTGPRTFDHFGRSNSMIKVNGINLDLCEVCDYLMSEFDHLTVQAITHRDEIRGSQFELQFTASDLKLGIGDWRHLIFTKLAARFGRHAAPKSITRVNHISRTDSGKVPVKRQA